MARPLPAPSPPCWSPPTTKDPLGSMEGRLAQVKGLPLWCGRAEAQDSF